LWYLFAAYSIAWAVIFGYIFVLVFRQNRLKRELDSLKEATKQKATSQKGS